MGDVYLRCDFPDCPVEMLYCTETERRKDPRIGEQRVAKINWLRQDIGQGRTISFCPMHSKYHKMGIFNLEAIWKIRIEAMRQKTATAAK